MGQTNRWNLRYPPGSTANDYPLHMEQLAEDVDALMAGDSQGLLAARPAAGKRGRFYNATDDSLFRDDGTGWVRLTPGPWKNFSATPFRLQNGGGGTVTTATFQWLGTPVCRFRLTPGSRVEYEIDGLAHLSGTQQGLGIEWTLPTAQSSVSGTPGHGDVFNDTPRVEALDGVIGVYPTGAYGVNALLMDMVNNNRTAAQSYAATGIRPGQWPVDNIDRWVRIQGFYSTP